MHTLMPVLSFPLYKLEGCLAHGEVHAGRRIRRLQACVHSPSHHDHCIFSIEALVYGSNRRMETYPVLCSEDLATYRGHYLVLCFTTIR